MRSEFAPPQRLGKLASGEEVVNRRGSHLHEGVRHLLPEALAKITSAGRPYIVEEVEFNRVIGHATRVATNPQDKILYAMRPRRKGYSRFALNRHPEPCTSLVVILKKDEEEAFYLCITAFIGTQGEPEPWDKHATEHSLPFWSTHALLWGHEDTILGTETDDCPW